MHQKNIDRKNNERLTAVLQDAEFRLNKKDSLYLRKYFLNTILTAIRVPHLVKPRNVKNKNFRKKLKIIKIKLGYII